MADYATTKIVKTLRFPGDTTNQYQVNAVKLDGHTWSEVEAIDQRIDTLESFDALRYMGALEGGATLPAANKGDVYKVSKAGTLAGATVEVGDMLICNTDNTAANTAANWDIIQGNVDVASILAHTHSGSVTFKKTAKTLSHSVTPTEGTLTATFTNGTATVTGDHGHTASGKFSYTPGGTVGDKSITPAGTVALTAPSSAGTGDVTLTPSGTIANSATEFVKSVTVSEHAAHKHTASSSSAGGHTPEGTVTVDEYTPEGTVTVDAYTPLGTVQSHTHSISLSAPTASHNAVGSVTTTYSGSGDDGVLTISTTASNVTYVKSVSITDNKTGATAPTFTGTSKAPTASFAGTAKAPTAEFSGTPIAAHSHTITVENATVAAHTVTAPTATHAHGFTGNDMFVHAAFTGTAATHNHSFTGTAVTNQAVTVTVNDFDGNFSGTATGTVTPSVSKVLTGVTIDNHSIDTVDSGSFTTGNGTQN